MAWVQDIMLQMTGGRSVPRVFINGQFIGGWCPFPQASSRLTRLFAAQLANSRAVRLASHARVCAGGDDTVAKAASGELVELYNKA